MADRGLSEQVGSCAICTYVQWKSQMTVTEQGMICQRCRNEEKAKEGEGCQDGALCESKDGEAQEVDNRGGIGKAPLL